MSDDALSKLLDEKSPELIGSAFGAVQVDNFGGGRIMLDQHGSPKWRASLTIFNGPQFTKEAETPSEALKLVLIEADREAREKVRRYRQAMNDKRGADIAAAVQKREDDDQRAAAVLAKQNAPADDGGFDALMGDDEGFEAFL